MAEKAELPHSEECERAVLGGLLLDPGRFGEVSSALVPSDFFFEKHQGIYAAMLALAESGEPIDILTLRVELERRGTWEAVGGMAYIALLDSDLPDLGRLSTYAEIVRRKGDRRRLMERSKAVYLAAGNGKTDQQVLDLAAQAFQNTSAEFYSRAEKAKSMPDAVEAWLEDISERKEDRRSGAKTGTAVDRYLGEFARGKFYIAAGDPGVGKSAFAVQVLEDCIHASRPTLFFSNEMKEEAVYSRWISHRFGIDSRDVASGRGMSQATWTGIIKLLGEMRRSGRIVVVNRRDRTWREMAEELRREHGEHGIELCMLDHYHMPGLWPTDRGGKTHVAIGELTNAMAKEAQALNIAMIAMGQLSRGSDKEQRPPRLTDLREGGEAAADGVLFLWRPPVGRGSDGDTIKGPRGRFILAKHRDGAEGWAPVIYDGMTSRWCDDPEAA